MRADYRHYDGTSCQAHVDDPNRKRALSHSGECDRTGSRRWQPAEWTRRSHYFRDHELHADCTRGEFTKCSQLGGCAQCDQNISDRDDLAQPRVEF